MTSTKSDGKYYCIIGCLVFINRLQSTHRKRLEVWPFVIRGRDQIHVLSVDREPHYLMQCIHNSVVIGFV